MLVLMMVATVVKAQPATTLHALESCYTSNTGFADATGAVVSRSDAQKQQLVNCLGNILGDVPRKAYLLSQESPAASVCEAAKAAYLPAVEACGAEMANAQNYRGAHTMLHAAVMAGSSFALGILLEESMDEDGFGAAIPKADKVFYAYMSCNAGARLQVNQTPEVLYVPALRERLASQLRLSSVALNPTACANDIDRLSASKLSLQQLQNARSRAAATASGFSEKARVFLTQYPEYLPFNASLR